MYVFDAAAFINDYDVVLFILAMGKVDVSESFVLLIRSMMG